MCIVLVWVSSRVLGRFQQRNDLLPEKNQFANFSHNTSFKKVHMKHLLIFVSKYKALYLLRNFAHLYSFGSLLFYKSIFLFLFYSILLYNHASQENLQDKVFSGNSSFYPSSLPGSFNPFHRESFFLFICGLKVKVSHVQLFVTPWTIQSIEFSRPEYQSGQPFLLFKSICEIYRHLALFTLYSGDHSTAIHKDVFHLECGFEKKCSSYKVSFLIT